jgi:uncharacterized repeat protein (TIGR03833 family)
LKGLFFRDPLTSAFGFCEISYCSAIALYHPVVIRSPTKGLNDYKGVEEMNGQNRKEISPGLEVNIVLKQDQRTGKLTRGVVKDILTNSPNHPHGIKVRLEDGQVGRVKEIVGK